MAAGKTCLEHRILLAFGHDAKSTMALNIITALQGGTCGSIQSGGYIHT